MANTFKVITCPMTEAESTLNSNIEEWALHLFIPNAEQTQVTMVLLSQRVMRMQQIGRSN